MIWIISDTHFNHKTMINAGWRKYNSVEDMNEAIINNWNSLISPEDTVYHLGDVIISKKSEYHKLIEPRLNGKIIYIRGNHDSKSLSNIISIVIDYKGKLIELIHNPVAASGKYKYVIHGHLHKTNPENRLIPKDIICFNANLEFHNFKPTRLPEAIGKMNVCKSL